MKFLVSGGLDREEFAEVFQNWLQGDKETQSARIRFLQGFCQRNVFTIDRFVGAANCFDLLPRRMFSSRDSLPDDVEEFIRDAEQKAKKLSDQGLRERALAGLGRLRAINLRDRIVQRYESIPPILKGRTKDAEYLVRHCVRVRNYFVHGSDPGMPIEVVYEFLSFFTQMLEFIFVSADFNECGWDAKRWSTQPVSRCLQRMFLHEYDSRLEELRKVVSNE